MPPDVVSILEACYDRGTSPEAWIARVHSVLRESFGFDGGFAFYASASPSLVPSLFHADCDPTFISGMFGLIGELQAESFEGTLRHMKACYRGTFFRSALGVIPPSENWSDAELRAHLATLGLLDLSFVGFSGTAESRIACLAPRRTDQGLSLNDHALGQVGVHLLAGLRLASLPNVEPSAWLRPDGKLLSASDEAASVRDVLSHAVRAMDRAKTRACRSETPLALELWCGLVEGRWSLVEVTESDGRRLMLAVENGPAALPISGLSSRETQISSLLAMGYSEKLVAYGLGISRSSVSTYVHSACRKLGLSSRIELARVIADLIGVASSELH